MVELVDTSGLSPVGLVRVSSSLTAGTSDQRSSRRTSKPLLVLLGRAKFEGENPKAFGGAMGSKFQKYRDVPHRQSRTTGRPVHSIALEAMLIPKKTIAQRRE